PGQSRSWRRRVSGLPATRPAGRPCAMTPPMAADPLLKWREEFPILGRKTYLINNSLGAMPRRVYDRLKDYADTWARDGVEAWHEWLPMVTKTGDLIGRLIGAPAGTVVMHQNVSTLSAILASGLDFGTSRNRVVYDELNFPSVHYV